MNVCRISHRKWRQSKQQLIRLLDLTLPGCILVSFHILCDILQTVTVGFWPPSLSLGSIHRHQTLKSDCRRLIPCKIECCQKFYRTVARGYTYDKKWPRCEPISVKSLFKCGLFIANKRCIAATLDFCISAWEAPTLRLHILFSSSRY